MPESVKVRRVNFEKVLVSWSKLKDGREREAFTTPRYLAIIFLYEYDIIIGETIVDLLLYHSLWVLLLPIFVGSTVFFMINGLPEISIKYFSELASITYCLRLHNLFVNIVDTLEPKYARDQLQ